MAARRHTRRMRKPQDPPGATPLDHPAPRLTPAAEAARAARLERSAAALRQNLRRRKAAVTPAEPPPPPKHG